MKTSPKFSSALMYPLALLTASLLIPPAMLLADDAPPKLREADAQAPPAEAQSQQRLISLVLLLSEPRTLDAGAVTHAVSRAVGTEVPDDSVVAKGSSFMVKAGSRKFAIHSVSEPYFEEGDKLAAELREAALADAVRRMRIARTSWSG